MIQPLLTTAHSFLYVHIRFRIAIIPNWNNYYNITKVPTTLCLSQIKRISGSQYFLRLFANSTLQEFQLSALSLCECKLVFLFGASACICSKNLYFARTKFEIWLVNKGHGKMMDNCKICCYRTTKANKFSSCYLFLSLSEQVVYFHETDIIVLFWVIIYRFWQKFFKIGVLKTFAKFTGKHMCATYYFLNNRLLHRCFVVNFAKPSRTPFLSNTCGPLLLYISVIP